MPIRNNWTIAEIADLYRTPFLTLVSRASAVHAAMHSYEEIQCCTLLSIKTGGCPEDCSYCPQAARYDTGLEAEKLMDAGVVLDAARTARDAGATRFCMGAAWREVRDNSDFDRVLEMVRGVGELGLEVCCTLGMLTATQAERLADAGLHAYNHNLDTSRSFYEKVISTREYDDRLATINNVRKAGITVCSGGIIGMGESEMDRIAFLHTLATLDPHPESVPINALVPVPGTPLGEQPPIDPFELVRMIACARILMPAARVRLSAGRLSLSDEAQALAFLAGANSIFTGERLLTTPNPSENADEALLRKLGVKPMPPHGVEFSITEPIAEGR
ncbi:MAG: biotin synthase BioB [Bacteroidota bacterium]